MERLNPKSKPPLHPVQKDRPTTLNPNLVATPTSIPSGIAGGPTPSGPGEADRPNHHRRNLASTPTSIPSGIAGGPTPLHPVQDPLQ